MTAALQTSTFYVPFAKVDAEQRFVGGYASTPTRDQQGEVVLRSAIEGALPDYMRFANVREMHAAWAVGVAKEAQMDDRGLWIGATIVDDAAWAKVREGVYKGFSIGGAVLARDNNDKSIITALELTEISLVDRPANPDAIYSVVKRVGGKLRQTTPISAAQHRAIAEEAHGKALAAHNGSQRARMAAEQHAVLAVKALANGDIVLHRHHEQLCGTGNRLANTYGDLERHHRAVAAHHRAMAQEAEADSPDMAKAFFRRFSRR